MNALMLTLAKPSPRADVELVDSRHQQQLNHSSTNVSLMFTSRLNLGVRVTGVSTQRDFKLVTS